MKRASWNSVFIEMAFTIAKRSPDAQTKCGCVIVNKENKVVSIGYNGFARCCKDENLPNTRPDKYPFMIHAENNAILNATSSLEGCTAYITSEPCHKCLMLLYQVGILKIFYKKDSPSKPQGVDEQDRKIKKIFLKNTKKRMQIKEI